MKQLIEETQHMLSGKFIIVMIVVPIIVAIVFGYVMGTSQINDGPLAIVDLDQSSASTELINKLDSSQYIDVEGVFNHPIDPNELLYNEKFLAVLYLPEGLELNKLQGIQSSLGFYVDMTISAATGNLRSAVTEVISTENSVMGAGRLQAMGLNESSVSGTLSNLALEQRLLYNPTNNTLNTAVIGFANTIIISVLTGFTISIVPRLREENRLQQALDNPFGILFRILPYAVVSCISLYLSIGFLKQIGGMRFEASPTQIWVPFLMFTICACLFAMMVGWTAPTAGKAGGRTLIAVVPSFLLGGVQSPVLLLPDLLQHASNLLPIAWHFKFIRGMGFRGGELHHFTNELAGFSLLILGIIAVIVILMIREKIKFKKSESAVKVLDEVNSGMKS